MKKMDLSNFSRAGEQNPWSDADSALSPLLNALNLAEKLGYVPKARQFSPKLPTVQYLLAAKS
jgi:hypothetical protein